MKKKYGIIIIAASALFILSTSYVTWNRLDPDFSCALCHEIRPACVSWQGSAHAGVSCKECHGTALSEGFTSLVEKSRMVYVHLTQKKTNHDLHLTGSQALTIAGKCVECHRAEHAAWQSGAHSTTYRDIFMDVAHNEMERPYWDCFRCHGAHYDGNIHDLMSLEGDVASWKIRDGKQAGLPAITCLDCHQIHGDQERHTGYALLDNGTRDSLMKTTRRPATALYLRAEKHHLPSDRLLKPTIHDGDSLVRVSDDPNTWLCMQCHSPNYRREAGTQDDKTPTGVYEGMSCLDCHDPHSNRLKNNYRNVHTSKLPLSKSLDLVY